MSDLDSNTEEIEHLMRLSQAGDRNAFADLCELRREQFVAEVGKKLDRRLLARVDPSDVVQEVFWDANRRLETVTVEQVPLIAWLRFLVNQKIVDLQRLHIRTQKRSVLRECRLDHSSYSLGHVIDQIQASLSTPSRQAQRHELASRVKQILLELSPIDREVLVLRHCQSLTNLEVAESLGISTNAASNRYIRALKRFKERLDIDGREFSNG